MGVTSFISSPRPPSSLPAQDFTPTQQTYHADTYDVVSNADVPKFLKDCVGFERVESVVTREDSDSSTGGSFCSRDADLSAALDSRLRERLGEGKKFYLEVRSEGTHMPWTLSQADEVLIPSFVQKLVREDLVPAALRRARVASESSRSLGTAWSSFHQNVPEQRGRAPGRAGSFFPLDLFGTDVWEKDESARGAALAGVFLCFYLWDRMVLGRVLDVVPTLRGRGPLDDPVLLMISGDHGLNFPSHLAKDDDSMFHTPLVMHDLAGGAIQSVRPSSNDGRTIEVTDQTALSSDLLSTFADLLEGAQQERRGPRHFQVRHRTRDEDAHGILEDHVHDPASFSEIKDAGSWTWSSRMKKIRHSRSLARRRHTTDVQNKQQPDHLRHSWNPIRKVATFRNTTHLYFTGAGGWVVGFRRRASRSANTSVTDALAEGEASASVLIEVFDELDHVDEDMRRRDRVWAQARILTALEFEKFYP